MDDMFGFIPNNIELYKLALIHKSASFVLSDGSQINNERLEYLGDAVIEAVTSDFLYIEFPDQPEGVLTQLRSKIVSRQSLNALAVKLGLDKLLVAHSGATISQKHIYGDAFEAMMGPSTWIRATTSSTACSSTGSMPLAWTWSRSPRRRPISRAV